MSNGERERTRLTPMQTIIGTALALVVAAIVIVFIGRAAGYAKLGETLRHGDEKWLALCVVGQVLVFTGYAGAFRTAVEFESQSHVATGLSVRIALAGFAFTQIVAAGGVAGLGITYWALRQIGFARRDAAVRLIGLNTAVFLVFGSIGLAAAIVALVLGAAPLGMTLPWIAGIPVVLVAASWFTEKSRVEKWATPQGGFMRRGLAGGIAAAWWVRRLVDSDRGPRMIGWSACYWAGDIASLWGALHAFGGAPIAALPLAYTTGYLAQSVPIPFVATGGMDAATTFALKVVGVPLHVALAAVIAHRVFAFWVPILPGLVLAATLPRTFDRSEAAARRGVLSLRRDRTEPQAPS